MNDNRFIPGVTDAGKPRAAKGGFPYPGHGQPYYKGIGEMTVDDSWWPKLSPYERILERNRKSKRAHMARKAELA